VDLIDDVVRESQPQGIAITLDFGGYLCGATPPEYRAVAFVLSQEAIVVRGSSGALQADNQPPYGVQATNRSHGHKSGVLGD
jgi:hypothetical protein